MGWMSDHGMFQYSISPPSESGVHAVVSFVLGHSTCCVQGKGGTPRPESQAADKQMCQEYKLLDT